MLMQHIAETAQERKMLEVKEKALKDELLEAMKAAGLEKQATQFGSFTVAHRTSYEYTDVVKKLEDSVKMKKVEEVEKGLAKQEVTDYILFKEAITK